MAVGYQYQNDYNKKQESKGFKKKLIILGAGIFFLIVIAFLGAPKKEVITNNPSPDQEVKQDEDNTTNQLPTKPDYVLSEEQKKIKLNTDGFLLSLINKTDYKGFLVPLVYSAVKDKPELVNTLSSKKLESCQLENIEKSDNINIVTYSCSGFYVFISTSTLNDSTVLNKIINWKIMDKA